MKNMEIKKQVIRFIIFSFLIHLFCPLYTVLSDEVEIVSDNVVVEENITQEDLDYFKIDDIAEITVLNERVSLTEDLIIIDGRSYNQAEFEELISSTILIQPRFAAAAGVYFVPGVGQILLAGTGVVIIAGATIYAGHWAWNTISNYLNAPKWNIARNYEIDHWILFQGGSVDLGKFKDKNGKTPLNKNSGTFKNGRYSVDKDTAGHGGRKWKLKKDGKRVASLDEYGNIISK